MSALSAEQPALGRPGPNLLLLGPPAAGKGSLAASLRFLNLEHVSSGGLFRAEAARGGALGDAFASALAKGEFVPDELTLSVMRKWYFARKQNRGFLLDGFPRNLLQAEALDEWLEARRDTLGACLYLKIGRDEAIVRISQRRVCPKDGSVYHLAFHPPKVAGICDLCGGPLIQRSDDTEETVVRRWRLFEEHTYPLVSYYRSRGLLLQFDASRPADEVSGDVVKTLSSCSLA